MFWLLTRKLAHAGRDTARNDRLYLGQAGECLAGGGGALGEGDGSRGAGEGSERNDSRDAHYRIERGVLERKRVKMLDENEGEKEGEILRVEHQHAPCF